MGRFITRDSEAGNPIESFTALEDAMFAVEGYIREDKCCDTFTEDFYEIFDQETSVVYDANGEFL